MSSSLTTGSSSAAGTAEAPAWKHYPFFDVVEVKDAHDLESSPDIFKAALEISTTASSSVGLLIADIHGSVHVLNRDFEALISWIAHTAGRVTHMAECKGILVTLGEEDAVRSPLLKIWDLGSRDKKTGGPVLLRSAKAQHSNKPHPVSSIALSSNLSYLAIGLGDGTVLFYKHLDQSLVTGLAGALTSIPKPRVIHESPGEPITGLGFKEPSEDDSTPGFSLFITTISRVLIFQVSGRSGGIGSGSTAEVVDEIGCGLGCAAIDWGKQNIVVAKDEAVYYVGVDGRGPCYAYEGTKSSLHTHANYLIIVSPPFVPSAADASATVRNFVARTPNRPAESDITKISVFEPENKYVAYSGTFTQDVREVISQWGNIYILTSDGKLLCLQEKSTATKLDFLYRKLHFTIALSLAKTQRLDASVVADIHKQYGDHLYGKGEYDQAMQQYVQTIGHLQPSHVIRKFLSSQRIHNLVTYLQELHSLGLANADHTTLLLNTYTKLKDVSRLDSFIKTESKGNADSDGKEALPFDLETAIRVCRQAGYFEHASYLARKYKRHEDYLRIQIEDSGNYADALAYLRKLGPASAESNLARYGRAMLENLPQETTQLLIDLCTTSTLEVDEGLPAAQQKQTQGLPILSYLVNLPTAIPPAVTTDNALSGGGSHPASIHQDSQSPPATIPNQRPATPPSGLPASSTADAFPPLPPPVKRLSPRVYFAHFVDHRDQFVTFLETVGLRRWGQSLDGKINGTNGTLERPLDEEADQADQVAVWNTLLELYLTSSQQPHQDKALRVLQSTSLPYDHMHALILCSTRNYTSGLVLLWEKMGMYEDVLRFWMDKEKENRSNPDVSREASRQVVQQLDKYGPEHPQLYTLVLRFLTSTPELLSRHTDDVKRFLQIVDEEEILPPLGIVQLLSRNEVASVGLIKQWLIERVKLTRSEIQKDRQLTTSYRLETAAKLKQVEALKDPEGPHVFHVTRCSSCGGQLDLPSYHFMCDHSFHQRCLGENEECPKCAREYSVIREIRRTNERLADQHDVLLSEVQESGFEAIAAAFGRALSAAQMKRPYIHLQQQPSTAPVMDPNSVVKGTKHSFSEIPLHSIVPQNCSVTLEDVQCLTSYDIGRNHLVTPSRPPHWLDQELPVQLSPDPQATDPRHILPPCPLDPMLRSLIVTSPDISLNEVDVIVERKNLRALFNFVNGESVNHRIDAELIGNTLLIYIGWVGSSYGTPGVTYGMNFEHQFTSPTPEAIVHHERVIQYRFGGLKIMTKYQVDACLASNPGVMDPGKCELISTSASGLQTFKSGRMISRKDVAEIKTLRLTPKKKRPPPSSRTLQQLWFSQTPILISGYHDGTGYFSAVQKTNVIKTGALKRWEERNADTLRKVVKLIQLIRAAMENAPAAEGSSTKTTGIVIRSGKYEPMVTLHALEPGYLASLPQDLRLLWN